MATASNNDKSPKKQDEDLEAHRVNLFLHAENVRVFDTPKDRQLPVTLVTGHLGSGKTTLLHHVLTHKHNLRIAAAVNDFAELNIDENLIQHRQTGRANQVVELSNGCVCCHLLDDLKAAVWKLLGEGELDAINYLVIETSGVSDPAAIIRTLDAKFGKCYRARLDSVVTVVDADQMLNEDAAMTSQAALAQLQCADVIILNKMDLLNDPEKDCQALEQRIRSINPTAVVHPTNHCRIPLSNILDVTLPDTSRGAGPTHEASQVPIYVSATGGALRRPSSLNQDHQNDHNHLQKDDFVSISVTLKDGPLSLYKLQQFVTSQPNLARMKGVVWIDAMPLYRCVLHWSGRGRLGFRLDGKWTGPPQSEMAFIGRASTFEANSLETRFADCQATTTNSNNGATGSIKEGMDLLLVESPEFVVLEWTTQPTKDGTIITYFRLTGTKIYGYTEEEIERDLRIDTDAMNLDLVDAVNASVDQPKAFLAYDTHASKDDRQRIVLCFTGQGEPANNTRVLLREARAVLKSHFRNVQVCKCGT